MPWLWNSLDTRGYWLTSSISICLGISSLDVGFPMPKAVIWDRSNSSVDSFSLSTLLLLFPSLTIHYYSTKGSTLLFHFMSDCICLARLEDLHKRPTRTNIHNMFPPPVTFVVRLPYPLPRTRSLGSIEG